MAYANPYTYARYYWMPPDYLGDVNGDRKIDLIDVYRVTQAFGSYWPGYPYPPSENWDSRFNIDGDGEIDLKDYFAVCKRYGDVDSSSQYMAYSTDYEFTVPDDGGAQVCYHHIVKMYIPEAFNGRSFYFITTGVDNWVLNVMLNGHVKYEGEPIRIYQ